jgi:hypothetical protein
MLPYLSTKEGNLFCFFMMIFPKPRCIKLCYGIYHQKVLNEYGCNDLVLNVWSYNVESIDY